MAEMNQKQYEERIASLKKELIEERDPERRELIRDLIYWYKRWWESLNGDQSGPEGRGSVQ